MSSSEPAGVAVLDDPGRVAALLPPLRRRILQSLQGSESAASLARRMKLPRQNVTYHLRELERAGLVEFVDERRRRGCVERRVRASARAFVVSPNFLGELGADPESVQDRFSSAYLMATASRALRDVALLRDRARAVEKKLATVALEAEIRFASPAELNAFADELAASFAALVQRFHDPASRSGRSYRFAVVGHPTVTKSESQAAAERADHVARTRARKSKQRRVDR